MKTIKCSCKKYDLPDYVKGDFRNTATLVCSFSTHSPLECEWRWAEASQEDIPMRYNYTSKRIRPLPPPLTPIWRSRTQEWKDIERNRTTYSEDRQQWPGEEWLRHVTQILTSGGGGGLISDNALCHALALIELRIGSDFKAEKHAYFNDHREFSLMLILNNLAHSGTVYDTWIKAAERIVGELMRRSN